MAVDQQWIGHVTGNDRELVNINIIDIINQLDTTTLGRVSWLNDPNVLLAIMLFELLVVLIELTKLVRKDVGIRNEVEVLLSKPFLHSHDVEAKPILSSDFMTLREMIDLLIFVQAFIEIALATRRAPQNVPFV